MKKKITFKPARFESQGSLVLNGQTIPYRTVSEDTVFYTSDGKPIATIFSYSYFRSDVEDTASRPVIFGYNGGPGSSSMYVHAGFLGARRIVYGEPDRPTALPPYEVIDNPNCLLDIADIVLVDPVATGYGALLDDTRGKDFFGIEQDAEAFLTFVEQWLHRHNRWLSPKYLVGESYGCTRSAIAAGIASTRGKERSYGIAFDGIVMIGNTVSVGKYFGREVPVDSAVICFPTYAAVNWYHNHPTDQTLEEFVKEAKAFADHDYLLALYQGDDLQGEAREAVIEKLMYYTGVSREYLEERDLRQVDEIPADKYKEQEKIQRIEVGDIVEVIDAGYEDRAIKGMTGVVVVADNGDSMMGIDFGIELSIFHRLGFRLEKRTGYWVPKSWLRLLKKGEKRECA